MIPDDAGTEDTPLMSWSGSGEGIASVLWPTANVTVGEILLDSLASESVIARAL